MGHLARTEFTFTYYEIPVIHSKTVLPRFWKWHVTSLTSTRIDTWDKKKSLFISSRNQWMPLICDFWLTWLSEAPSHRVVQIVRSAWLCRSWFDIICGSHLWRGSFFSLTMSGESSEETAQVHKAYHLSVNIDFIIVSVLKADFSSLVCRLPVWSDLSHKKGRPI